MKCSTIKELKNIYTIFSFYTCIGDPSTYLTVVGLHDAITIMSWIFTVCFNVKHFDIVVGIFWLLDMH